jgi:hypothetical protein
MNMGRQPEQTESKQAVEQVSQGQADLSDRQAQQNQAGSSEKRISSRTQATLPQLRSVPRD